jgi:hypothetical protein
VGVSCNAAYCCRVYLSFAFCFCTCGRVRSWYRFLRVLCFLFLVLYVAEEVALTLSCSRLVFMLWHLISLPILFVAATLCCFFLCVMGIVCRKLVMGSHLLVVGSIYYGCICEIPSWCSSIRYIKYVHRVTEGFLCMVCLQSMLSVILTGSIAVLIGVSVYFQSHREQLPVYPTCFN